MSDEPHGPCSNCGTRPATETWVGEGGAVGWVHGMYSFWCKPCCLMEQIKYAEAAAARLPALRAELDSLVLDERMEEVK